MIPEDTGTRRRFFKGGSRIAFLSDQFPQAAAAETFPDAGTRHFLLIPYIFKGDVKPAFI
jgi:hypothetical protein